MKSEDSCFQLPLEMNNYFGNYNNKKKKKVINTALKRVCRRNRRLFVCLFVRFSFSFFFSFFLLFFFFFLSFFKMWFYIVAAAVLLVLRAVSVSRQRSNPGKICLKNESAVRLFVGENRAKWLQMDSELFSAAKSWSVVNESKTDKNGANLSIRKRSDPSGNSNDLFWYYANSEISLSCKSAAQLFGTQVNKRKC